MISEVVRLFGESVSRCDFSRFSTPYTSVNSEHIFGRERMLAAPQSVALSMKFSRERSDRRDSVEPRSQELDFDQHQSAFRRRAAFAAEVLISPGHPHNPRLNKLQIFLRPLPHPIERLLDVFDRVGHAEAQITFAEIAECSTRQRGDTRVIEQHIG
jgi:hypothetical protein